MNPPMREGTGSVCKTAAHRPFSFDEGDAAFWGSWAPPPGSGGCPGPAPAGQMCWVGVLCQGLVLSEISPKLPAFSNATFA